MRPIMRLVAISLFAIATLTLSGCGGPRAGAADAIRDDILAAQLGFDDVQVSDTTDSEGLAGYEAVVGLSVPRGGSVTSEQLASVLRATVPHLDGYRGVRVYATYTGADVEFLDLQPLYTELGFPAPPEGRRGSQGLWTTEAHIRDVLKIKDEG